MFQVSIDFCVFDKLGVLYIVYYTRVYTTVLQYYRSLELYSTGTQVPGSIDSIFFRYIIWLSTRVTIHYFIETCLATCKSSEQHRRNTCFGLH